VDQPGELLEVPAHVGQHLRAALVRDGRGDRDVTLEERLHVGRRPGAFPILREPGDRDQCVSNARERGHDHDRRGLPGRRLL
jgi:hypothetical protein